MAQLEKCTPYYNKSIHLKKAFSSRKLQKWHSFCSRGNSENTITDQTLKFCLKMFIASECQIFQHAIPHMEFKAKFMFFKPSLTHTYIVCWGSHICFTEKLQGEKR